MPIVDPRFSTKYWSHPSLQVGVGVGVGVVIIEQAVIEDICPAVVSSTIWYTVFSIVA